MSDKLLRALRKLDPGGGLDEVGAKTLSDGLRSEALPVVEAALAVCAAARGAGGTAAPLAHAWPRAPAAALPLMAAALVEVALQTADSGMLLRLTPSRADGGVELAAAVADRLREPGAEWGVLRPFVVGFLFRGTGGGEAWQAAGDAYARVQLHDAALRAPRAGRHVALLPLCYGAGGSGWEWAATALRQLLAAGVSVDGASLLPELCVHHAMELAEAGRSSLPALRLLAGCTIDTAASGSAEATRRRLLIAAVHLLLSLSGAAERAALLRWLREAIGAGLAPEPPLLALLIAAVLRTQHSDGPNAATAEAEAMLPSLVSALSAAGTKPPAAAAASAQPLTSSCARPQRIAEGFCRSWHEMQAADASAAMEAWFSQGCETAQHVGDTSTLTMIAVCSAALFLHPAPRARLAAMAMVQSSYEARSAAVEVTSMTHLPMVLHALNVEKEAAVQVRLNPLTLTLLSRGDSSSADHAS